MIVNILKTLPRDCRLVSRHIKSLLKLSSMEKKGSSVGKAFDSYALENPEKVAFIFKDEKWTFKQVYERSNKIGNFFARSGIKKSDVVALFMENRPEYICTWLGLSKIGAVTALVNFNLRSMPLKHCFDLSQAKAIVCGHELSEAFSDVYPENSWKLPVYGTGKEDQGVLSRVMNLDNEISSFSHISPPQQNDTSVHDDLFYLYTSGTTGFPKAAVIKHFRFLMAGVAGKNANKIREDDILYATLPLYHTNSGIIGASQTLICGTTMALREKFSARNFWKDCIKYEVTVAQYMGEVMRYLLRQPPSPEERQHKVRLMLGNGLRSEIWEEFVTRFNIKEISEIYGATEGNISFLNFDNKIGACGFVPLLLQKLFPYVIIKLGKDGEPVRDSQTGLLIPCAFGEPGELIGKIDKGHPFRDYKGYASDAKASAKKILYDVLEKGDSAFRTGDIFTRDNLGYYYFISRSGESYRWKGENVSSTEVEYVISNLTPGRLDTVVFPVKIPHTDGLAGMAAIADPTNTLDLDILSENIKKNLPSYAIPLFLRITKEIEMTGTHKMKKTQFITDGYDISAENSDKLFFWKEGKYVTLTQDLYNSIQTGEINL